MYVVSSVFAEHLDKLEKRLQNLEASSVDHRGATKPSEVASMGLSNTQARRLRRKRLRNDVMLGTKAHGAPRPIKLYELLFSETDDMTSNPVGCPSDANLTEEFFIGDNDSEAINVAVESKCAMLDRIDANSCALRDRKYKFPAKRRKSHSSFASTNSEVQYDSEPCTLDTIGTELRKGPNDIVRAEPCQFLRFLFEHETCRAGMACKNNACVLTCFAVAARFPLRERNRVYSSIPFPWLPGPPGAKPQRFCRDSALDLSGVTIQQYITSAVSRVAASSHSDG